VTLAAVGFAVFAALATAKAPEHQVKRAYRAWLQAHSDNDPQRVCALTDPERRRPRCISETEVHLDLWVARAAQKWVRFDIVDVEVEGSEATATLRAGACTLPVFDAVFRRDADGRWWYSHGAATTGNDPPCYERGVTRPRL
jgi:hypothetical protein